LDKDWWLRVVVPKTPGRDIIVYELHLPVWLMVCPHGEDVITFHMDGLLKRKQSGRIIWNSRRPADANVPNANHVVIEER